MHCIYIIKSDLNNWYYVGYTSNIQKRISQHNSKEVRSTKFRAPFTLVYKEEYSSALLARLREKELKTNRCKKNDIIKKLALSSNG